MTSRPRGLTIRLRLTLLIGALFIAAGSILLGMTYLLVRHSVTTNPGQVRAALAHRLGVDAGQLPPNPARTIPNPDAAGRRNAFRDVQREITNQNLHRLLVESGIALGVMAVVSVGLGWVVAGRMLRPLHTITTTARRLSDVNLHERIGLEGPSDELKELADTFDAMLERLDRAFMSQQRFVADASHELRTPLSVIRTEVDVALADPHATAAELRAMGEVVRDATIRSEQLVDGLLTLARTGAAPPAPEPVDLADLAARVIDRLAPDADRQELALDLSLDPAPVRGASALLERLVENLVQNASQYNQRGGWIAVTTTTDGDHALLRVANSGPPVPPQVVASLFDRFRRLDPTAEGHHRGFGLGLSIVDAVARAHEGTATAEAQPDGGLLVTVDLPAAPLPTPVLTRS
ncbi:MAG TPA: ATP-binding protein [Acidimicrobiia bacterium]|nr:ATP-binding protein [Acidimicrobiia bacterium]